MVVRGRWGDDGGGGAGVRLRWGRKKGEWRRVAASGYDEWIYRLMRNDFGFAGKSPSEKFSGGGSMVAGGGWWLPEFMRERETSDVCSPILRVISSRNLIASTVTNFAYTHESTNSSTTAISEENIQLHESRPSSRKLVRNLKSCNNLIHNLTPQLIKQDLS
ncbi:hypothetical protein Tco_1015706 [Tanacetum coccineum]|uniref:Uncharacterized protein n=1 Tax=Tanacetum coccineum TaxID=301880 RepID=A0ABQ5FLM1_9ASTR